MIASQNARILDHLEKGGSVTFLEALERFQTMHLPRRIKDLKESGHNITDEWERANGKRFKRYTLAAKS